MTVATDFDTWQNDTPGKPWVGSPNVWALRNFLRFAYGGMDLGSNVWVRPVTGGTLPSDHAFGAAGDWGYGNGPKEQEHGGPGREFVVDALIPWLIANSKELGIQRIHDYIRKSIWQAGRGWGGNPGSGGYWLHNATHPLQYFNGIPILDRSGLSAAPGLKPPEVDWDLIARVDAEMRATMYPGTPVKKGDTGRKVEAPQWRLAALGEVITVDGQFGPKTEEAVKRFQFANAIHMDGIVGPVTWSTLGLAMPAAPVPPPPPPPPTGIMYRVMPGDGFWRIAERTLWNGAAWKQIAAENGGEARVLKVNDMIGVKGVRATVVQPGDGWIAVGDRLGRDYREVQARNAWQGSMLHPGMLIWGGAA